MSSHKKLKNISFLNAVSVKKEDDSEMRLSMPFNLHQHPYYQASKNKTEHEEREESSQEKVKKSKGRLCRGQDGKFKRFEPGMSPIQDVQPAQVVRPIEPVQPVRPKKAKKKDALTTRELFECNCTILIILAIICYLLIPSAQAVKDPKPSTPSSIPEIPNRSDILPIFREQLQKTGKIELDKFRDYIAKFHSNINQLHWYRFIDELNNEANITWYRRQQNSYITLRE